MSGRGRMRLPPADIDLANFNIHEPRNPFNGRWITLFRGEGSHNKPSYYPTTGPDALAGAWWTESLDSAKGYAAKTVEGKVYEIRVKETEAERRGAKGYYVIPDPKVRARRQLYGDEPHEGKVETRAWLKRHPVASANVVDMWDKATPGEKEAGEVWYPNAHKVALALGKRYKVSTREAAGLMAVYSPQTPWGQNVRNAAEALREHRPLGGPGAHIWWHRDPDTPNTVEWREGIMAPGYVKGRATKLMAGEDFEDVFSGGRNKDGSLKPNSLKVRAFGELIANGVNDPKDPKVVIDRHAAGVARGVRLSDEDYNIAGPSTSRKKFSEYSKAFRDAAKQISEKEGHTVPPEAVQAATWLTRQRLNSDMENQVGKTRSTLGNLDTEHLDDYVEQYLPEALNFLPQVGYSDLAVPYAQRSHYEPLKGARRSVLRHHVVTPRVDKDSTVRHIAKVLLASHRFDRIGSDYRNEVEGIRHLLSSYGVQTKAVKMALALTQTKGSYMRGTAHSPNARLAEHGATLTGKVRDVRDAEVYYRAAYIANAAHRMQRAMDGGATEIEAQRREAPYYRSHEHARKGRLDSAAQVQTAAKVFGWKQDRGTLVGWYLNPLLNNEIECITANGHNFYAEEGTVIGLPGSVHNQCGCYAGPPISGVTLVNEALHNVVKFQRSKPKFKLRKSA